MISILDTTNKMTLNQDSGKFEFYVKTQSNPDH